MEGLADFNDPQIMPFDELLELGRAHDAQHRGEWEQRVAASKADELALLVYTSGTTGPAKGAMLSHRNVIFQIANADAFIPIGTDDEQLAFLPLCHIAERTFTSFLPLRSGAIANFAESIETVAGERARSGADYLLRRATHLGALPFQHRHPHEGGDLDRSHRPTPGPSASASRFPTRGSKAASRRPG